MLFAGVDLGSTTAKVVIMEKDVLVSILGPTGAEHRRTANRVMARALDQIGAAIDDLEYVVATGYGRINVPFADKQITEISCHARGVHWSFPSATAVIDIGGQDSKGMKLSQGRVVDFVMNDKCAAGTGRFLEVISEALGLRVEDIGPLSLKSQKVIKISNVCTVFAEQEVVSKLAEGAALEDILAGLHDAIASRLNAMFARLKMQGDIVVTGGGALNTGLLKAMEQKFGQPLYTPASPQFAGAIGAALLAGDLVARAAARGKKLKKGKRRLDEVTFFT